jgi:hypothetical protein
LTGWILSNKSINKSASEESAAHAGSSLADFSTLKMEAISSPETSVYTISTRRQIPEDDILHSHSREDLKSYIMDYSSLLSRCFSVSLRSDVSHAGNLITHLPGGQIWGEPESRLRKANKDRLVNINEKVALWIAGHRDVIHPDTPPTMGSDWDHYSVKNWGSFLD